MTDASSLSELRQRVPDAFKVSPRVRLMRYAGAAALILPLIAGFYLFDFSPARILNGLSRLGMIFSFMFPPYIWTTWQEWSDVLVGLGQTISMAFLGTLLGALVAFPLAFLGAKNIMPLGWVRLSTRRGFDALRAVEQIVLALIFIRAFGLGPLPGVFAIAVSEIGTFAKLFSEAIENTSRKPVDGVLASGGGPLQTIRLAIMPQAMPVILSIMLYNFESNTRSGTILGIVGAGGIGFLLADRIAAYRWPEAWTIIFLIVAVVYAIDLTSAWLRGKIIGKNDSVR
ncbi:phosphonate transport system permease protein [Rhizobium sp. BK529]|uniref:phosphonate ABC transporter, permease protein PhnE n=1 Tax=unclassified Rhizobium TaxID=2613769 RepID=UPI00104E808E|nr:MULTISPECIES: phosphonate ABC transporter, permease protein PhnE [unclassified Rhizobium]MBB3593598.1 phosphonate transport system permease protein [Rhizobium sp. BK529]TCS03386.1 phosphonate transport system permease protein [Rhizobium sp. BK418]